MQLGIAYVTEDRRQLGLILPMSIVTNITLPTLPRYLNAAGLGPARRGDGDGEDLPASSSPSARRPLNGEVGKLSGGNQQKVVLSKWLNAQPKLLILDEPTRGIDVRAKAEVHHIINDLAAQGLAIILISSDLPEVLAMSDRVLVMREGRQMGIFRPSEATQEAIMTAAMGQSSETAASSRLIRHLEARLPHEFSMRRFRPEQLRELVLVCSVLVAFCSSSRRRSTTSSARAPSIAFKPASPSSPWWPWPRRW